MGNYLSDQPSSSQIDALTTFIGYFAVNATIHENFTIFAQDDLIYRSDKADALIQAMKSFDHYHERE